MADKKIKLALIGTNGIPANYGGAETFYENLTKQLSSEYDITVYCSKKQPRDKVGDTYLGAKLKYWPLSANGWQSVPYDGLSVFHAAKHSDVLLVFGAGGAGFFIWLLRLFGCKKAILLNHGGLDEWKRKGYSWIERKVGYITRWLFRKKVIHVADNNLLANSLKSSFGVSEVNVIRYGGDNAFKVDATPEYKERFPFLNEEYYVSVARAQVDNNLHVVLEAFSKMPDKKLVFVSNFYKNAYGQQMLEQYKDYSNIVMIPGLYNLNDLNVVRSNASVYIHSHSQCGTPPSLCEAMCLGLPIVSFDCEINHEVTNDNAFFFKTADDLIKIINEHAQIDYTAIASKSFEWAMSNLTWKHIANQYSILIQKNKKE